MELYWHNREHIRNIAAIVRDYQAFVFDILMVEIAPNIFEKLMLFRKFGMAFKMVGSLSEIVTQSFKIDIFASWCPSKVKMALLLVCHLVPYLSSFWASLLEHSLNKLRVVPWKYLEFQVGGTYVLFHLRRPNV